MDEIDSLCVLLSQLLVAYTIEFDNEVENRMPHRTARGPAAKSEEGPWLVSMAMWTNYLRFVGPDSGPNDDIARLTNLAGLVRWGYVSRDGTQLTKNGKRARDVFRPLAAEMDGRWDARFGDAVATLRSALAPFDDRSLPSALPVNWRETTADRIALWKRDAPLPDLGSLLARVLLAFTLDFESISSVPLQLDANTLRAIGDGRPVKELPLASGTSKEAVAGSLTVLEARGLVVRHDDKTATPTATGRRAQAGYPVTLARVEASWGDVEALRAALLTVRNGDLAAGLTPYPDGWRAHPPYLKQTEAVLRDPRSALPHYPMVLHRGAYPDGS